MLVQEILTGFGFVYRTLRFEVLMIFLQDIFTLVPETFAQHHSMAHISMFYTFLVIKIQPLHYLYCYCV